MTEQQKKSAKKVVAKNTAKRAAEAVKTIKTRRQRKPAVEEVERAVPEVTSSVIVAGEDPTKFWDTHDIEDVKQNILRYNVKDVRNNVIISILGTAFIYSSIWILAFAFGGQ